MTLCGDLSYTRVAYVGLCVRQVLAWLWFILFCAPAVLCALGAACLRVMA